MMKRFSHLIAGLLLVLIPLQTLAAVNMLVCNSVMQSNATQSIANEMPCHQMNRAITDVNKMSDREHLSCKAHCASICASMCALTVASATVPSDFSLTSHQTIDLYSQHYISIAQPRLQRPPITFI